MFPRFTPTVDSNSRLQKIDPVKSFIAGGTAGAIEGVITYPFEWSKTRLQLIDKSSTASRNPLVLIYNTAKAQGVGSIYTGCPAFVVGNTVKASVRFLGFDSIKKLLADKEGKLSGPRGVIAGLGAGLLESVIAVTPFEAIKTALIDDKQLAKPKYQGSALLGSVKCVKDLGFKGLYAGVLPVSLRQASNQAVRLGCYNKIKSSIQAASNTPPDQPLSSLMTFAVGAFSGIVTVYTTMPIDTVKTRMQALGASEKYSSTLNCFAKIFKEEGLKTFWKGATPRLGRLVLSGGIVFTIYEKVLVILQ
jgi:solute carrier family 25 citrate transporter 1